MRLWYGHSIVGRAGASGCGVRGVWGNEALATQGEAAQELGVGGGLLAGIGAHNRRPGGLGGHRDRAAGANGDRALADAAGRPRSGADDDRSRPHAPQARGVRRRRRERGSAHPGRLRGLRTVLRRAGLISRFVNSKEEAMAEALIRERVEDLVKALNAKDIDGVMSFYAPNLVSFDIAPQFGALRYFGAENKRRAWQEALATFTGSFDYEVHELNVTTEGELAFVHSLNHVRATLASAQITELWVRTSGQSESGFRMCHQ